MIFFLYGTDSFRRAERLRELVAPYKAKYASLDLLSVDLDDEPEGWIGARDFLNQPSMFVESKVAVIKEPSAVEEREWIKTLEAQLDTKKTFVFLSQKNPPAAPFGFLSKSPVKSLEFDELSSQKLDAFLKNKTKELGLVFSPQAFGFLSSYIGASAEKTALASNELEKIVLMNFKMPVGLDDLKKAVTWSAGTAAYVLSAEILRLKDFRLRLKPLEKIFLSEDPYYAFNSLSFQSQGAQAAALADYDISIKSGGLEQAEALLDFALGA